MIACRTIIGYGAPNVQGTSATHGSALGDKYASSSPSFSSANVCMISLFQNTSACGLALSATNADGLELRGNLQYWKYLLRLEQDPTAANELRNRARADLDALHIHEQRGSEYSRDVWYAQNVGIVMASDATSTPVLVPRWEAESP